MTREVRTCRPDDSLHAAAKVMWDCDCGCVPVVDDDRRVIGMLTDRDICMAAYTQERPLSSLRVSDAMSKEVFACSPGDPVSTAEEVMRTKQVRRLPVVEDGRLAGIVSLNDLSLTAARPTRRGKKKEITTSEVGETLAAIGVHRPESATSSAA